MIRLNNLAVIFLFIPVLFLGLVIFSILYEKKDIRTSSVYGEMAIDETGLFNLINEERENKLSFDDCLLEVARKSSKDMFERDYFSHQDPETNRIETWGMIKNSCGDYIYAGENLVTDFKDYNEAHKALMKSPDHKANILNNRPERGAVGCHEGICTQLFAKFYEKR
jgi:uncharacterized protein YkwD